MKNILLLLISCFTYFDSKAQDDALSMKIQESTFLNSVDGSIDLTVKGGFAPYSFAWSGPGDFYEEAEDLSGLASGEYCVVVSDQLCGVVRLCGTVKAKENKAIPMGENISIDAAVIEKGTQAMLSGSTPFEILRAFPNPFSNQLRIQVNLQKAQWIQCNLINAQGKLVFSHGGNQLTGIQSIDFDLSQLVDGIYILQVCDESGCRASEKLIKMANEHLRP